MSNCDPTCRTCGKEFPLPQRPRLVCCNGTDCGCLGATIPDDFCTLRCYENDPREECACGKLFDPVDKNGEERDCCDSCLENEAEAAYERAHEEPCFRGREWEAAQQAEADLIRRTLK